MCPLRFLCLISYLRLLYTGLLNLNNRRLLHRDAAVLVAAELYDHHIVGDVDDYAVETAAGQYTVSDSKACHHLVYSLFLLLLRTVAHEVEDTTKDYHV